MWNGKLDNSHKSGYTGGTGVKTSKIRKYGRKVRAGKKSFSHDNRTEDFSNDLEERFLQTYFKDLAGHPILNREKEFEMWEELKNLNYLLRFPVSECSESILSRINFLKDTLIKGNLRMVVIIAKKNWKSGISFLDLIQEGNLGLMKAMDVFDHEMGPRFSTYASYWIEQKIKRYKGDRLSLIRVAANIYELIGTYEKEYGKLLQKLERKPTDEEMAEVLQVNITHVLRAKEAVVVQNVSYLENLLAGSGKKDKEIRFIDTVASDYYLPADEYLERKAEKEAINKALGSVSSRERKVIQMGFGIRDGAERTLEETGKILGVTKEGIRKIELRALQKIWEHEAVQELQGC